MHWILAADSTGGSEALGAVLAVLFLIFIFFVFTLGPIVVGGLIGAYQEKKHFEQLGLREQALAQVALSDLKAPPPGMNVSGGAMVSGSVVIASDHFKSLCAKFRKFFGGEFHGLQRMQERGKREAILRMTEQAAGMGATAVCNVRVETSTISGSRPDAIAGAEVIAFGTALFPANSADGGA